MVAYILNLAEVVPNDFVLSNANIAEVQERLPNRNGKVAYPGLWSASGKPDALSIIDSLIPTSSSSHHHPYVQSPCRLQHRRALEALSQQVA